MSNHTYSKKIGGDSIFMFVVIQVERETVMTLTIPYKIGNTRFKRAMLDLVAFINVIPYSIYASLNLGPLGKTGVIIQLVDRSNTYPRGVVEDVLVQVNELVFPADVYVIDMEDEMSFNPTPILLGRPFLKIARTKIVVHD